jgi:hypothetical protein
VSAGPNDYRAQQCAVGEASNKRTLKARVVMAFWWLDTERIMRPPARMSQTRISLSEPDEQHTTGKRIGDQTPTSLGGTSTSRR